MAVIRPVCMLVTPKALTTWGRKYRQAVDGVGDRDAGNAQRQNLRVGQCLQDAMALHSLAMVEFVFLPPDQPVALIGGEPFGVRRFLGQVEIDHDGEDYRGNGFEDEDPLPAFQAETAVEIEHEAGQRRADHRRQRDGGHEHADDPAAVGGGEPERQVEDDAGEEAGLGGAEQETDDVKSRLAGDERHAAGEDAPGEHDPRDPASRADAHQDQVRRGFQQKVAEEENTGAGAIDSGGERQVLVHFERGKTQVHPVQIGDEITQDQKGYEPRRDLGHRARFDVFHVVSPRWACRLSAVRCRYRVGG